MTETKLTAGDVEQLRRIHRGELHTVMSEDVDRWRAAGWLEPAPSWKLTKIGLAIIGVDLFTSVPKEVFDALPRPSVQEIQAALDAGRPEELRGFRDPGPDLSPPSPVRPRTQAEVLPARDALRKLSDTLLLHAHPALRADGRLAWLLSVLPLSAPEEIGDALEFCGRVLKSVGDPDLYRGMLLADEQLIRRAVLGALSTLGWLVDVMRDEAEEDTPTDRRRSVAPPDELTQLEREWDAVPVEEVEQLLCSAKEAVEAGAGEGRPSLDRLAAVVSRIEAARAASSRS